MVDRLTPAQRSWNMSRIRGKNTSPELAVRRCSYRLGLRYRTHVTSLPGRPDMVFPGHRVAVFIDGDFWHGWRFPKWSQRLSPYWKSKIDGNRRRDLKNFRKLRGAGWRVVRIWEHEVKRDVDRCVQKIADAVGTAQPTFAVPGPAKRAGRRSSGSRIPNASG